MTATQSSPLLTVDGLVVRFAIRSGMLGRTRGWVHAVDGVSFTVSRGETFAIVGESGCGKSTTARAVLRLTEVAGGRVTFDSIDVATADRRVLRGLRRRMQIVFQDPGASLDTRLTIRSAVQEPLEIFRIGTPASRTARVLELLNLVGLDEGHAERYPHELSGGQRQRVGIARALATEPEFVALDEPLSALDVSIQSQIVNLLQDLQERLGLSLLLISHDLAVVRHIADRVAVMYLGRIAEVGTNEAIFDHPAHPYTIALLSAVPIAEPHLERARVPMLLTGDVPSPVDPPSGCRFHTRCPLAQEVCRRADPPLEVVAPGHEVACHRWREVVAGAIASSGSPGPSPDGSDEPPSDTPTSPGTAG